LATFIALEFVTRSLLFCLEFLAIQCGNSQPKGNKFGYFYCFRVCHQKSLILPRNFSHTAQIGDFVYKKKDFHQEKERSKHKQPNFKSSNTF
jgi:hypothetical protein